MKKLFISLILLTSLKILSQDLEKIKNADTVYVFFKADKINKENQFIVKSITSGGKKIEDYFFSFTDGQLSLQFTHHHKFFPDVRKEKKSFLKKNKDIIINYDFVKKISSFTITELIGYRKKVVYLIDYDEIGCFKIILKQVGVMGPRTQSIE